MNSNPDRLGDTPGKRPDSRAVETTSGPALRAVFAKQEAAHKYSYGHLLVLAGGPGKGGAARLAARAALRVGAGLVTLAPPQSAMAENAAQLNAVMLCAMPDAYALRGLLQDKRLNALILGPGIGLQRARELVPAALSARRATVLDADALSTFAEAPDQLLSQLHGECVLTPHAGEFARLFPDLVPDLAQAGAAGPEAAENAARAASRRAGCTVLLKGAQTVIAAPSGEVTLNRATGADAAPWLATAGTGDVLSGLIGGLLARGTPPYQAACAGAWLHAEAARSFGPGLISEDLPDQIPKVFRALGLS